MLCVGVWSPRGFQVGPLAMCRQDRGCMVSPCASSLGRTRGGNSCWHIVPDDTAMGQLQVAIILSSLEYLIQ